MAVRGDEVASSIEAHVREAIERLAGEIHSSIEDVRVAVDSQLKAAPQSVGPMAAARRNAVGTSTFQRAANAASFDP